MPSSEPPLLPPVAPVVVRRGYRDAPPFSAGGRRSLRLAARPMEPLHAPCSGAVRFVGSVAGAAPALTIHCASGRGGAMRITLAGLAPAVGAGGHVAAGATVGRALAAEFGLSVRRPEIGYVDPLPLLQQDARPAAPPVLGRRPARPRRWRPAPAVHGLRTLPAARPAAVPGGGADGPDLALGLAGVAAGLGGGLWWALGRRSRRGAAGAQGNVHPVTEGR